MARYYPRGTNRPSKGGLAPGNSNQSALEDNSFSEWLYKDDWSETKLKQYELLDSVPLVGDYMDYLLDIRADEEYLKRYGMVYSDIHDPRKLRQTSSGSRLIGGTLDWVSKNLDKLY